MTYISIDELKYLVPDSVMRELSDDITGGEINFDLVQTVISEACEEVDGYLRNRYALPFDNTPTLIKQCAKQIARYALYERRPEGFELPPAVVDGRKVAIKNLENIRDGKLSIGVPDTLNNIKSKNAKAILGDDGEFHIRVRPSRQNGSVFNNALLDNF